MRALAHVLSFRQSGPVVTVRQGRFERGVRPPGTDGIVHLAPLCAPFTAAGTTLPA